MRPICYCTGVLLLFLTGIASAADDAILAKAGDYVFRQSDFNGLISYSPPQVQKQLRDDPKQQTVLIRKVMEQKIIADLARKEGFDQTNDMKEKARYILNDFLAGEYLQATKKKLAAKVKLTDSDLRQYYQANLNIFTIPEQARVRQILIRIPKGADGIAREEARAKAKEIHKKLKAGGDFEKLAAEYSEDQATKGKGGDMGYLIRGQMEKSFDDVAFSLKPGETSYIVETVQGYHILFCENHMDSRVKSYDEAKDYIERQVQDRIAGEEIKDFIKKAGQSAGLEIFQNEIMQENRNIK